MRPNPSETRWDHCRPRSKLGPKFKGNFLVQQPGRHNQLIDNNYLLCKLASRKGIEPLTPGLGNLCSILLSYRDVSARRSFATSALRRRLSPLGGDRAGRRG